MISWRIPEMKKALGIPVSTQLFGTYPGYYHCDASDTGNQNVVRDYVAAAASLETLNFQNLGLSCVSDDIFERLPNKKYVFSHVEELNFANSGITELSWRAFYEINGLNVKRISFANNEGLRISRITFIPFSNLEDINLSGIKPNSSYIRNGFSPLLPKRLRSLDLSRNNFTKFPALTLESVDFLNISHNPFLNLELFLPDSETNFYRATKFKKIDITNTSLDPFTLEEAANMLGVDLAETELIAN